MAAKDRAEGYEILEVLIDGRWRQGAAGQSEPVTNPATGEILGHVPHVTADDLDEALDACAKGFRLWSQRSALERQTVLDAAVNIMTQRRDAIAKILTLERANRWERRSLRSISESTPPDGMPKKVGGPMGG